MKRFALAIAAVLSSAVAVSAADYPFTVTVIGKGRPVVLIPGFGCSGKVWDSTVAHFKDTCECHVLTLAGFAGVPPVKGDGPFLDTAVKGIAAYAKDKKLTDAVVIGHSLGAHVALRAAAAAPEQFSAAILVDGFPSMSDLILAGSELEVRKKFAADRRDQIANATRDEFLKQMREMFGRMLSGERLEEVMTWLAASDQPTAAKAMGELLSHDARPEVAKVRGPVVLLGAYNEGMKILIPSAEAFESSAKTQLKGATDARIAVHPDCGHFIMYDQPKWFFEKVEGVLKK